MQMCNQVLLCGQVTVENRIRTYPSRSGKVLSFELRTTEGWRHRGAVMPHDEYHRIVLRDSALRRLASEAGPLVFPGSRLLVMGALRHRVSAGPDLREMQITEVEATGIVPLAADFDDQEVQP